MSEGFAQKKNTHTQTHTYLKQSMLSFPKSKYNPAVQLTASFITSITQKYISVYMSIPLYVIDTFTGGGKRGGEERKISGQDKIKCKRNCSACEGKKGLVRI